MAKFPVYSVTVSIIDAKTTIELRQTKHTIVGRGGSKRAEWRAVEESKNFVLEHWARHWWYTHYLLTATQFDELVADKMINPIGIWHFEAVSCKYMGDVEK